MDSDLPFILRHLDDLIKRQCYEGRRAPALKMDFSDNRGITDQGILAQLTPFLTGWPCCRHLILRGTSMGDEGLVALSRWVAEGHPDSLDFSHLFGEVTEMGVIKFLRMIDRRGVYPHPHQGGGWLPLRVRIHNCGLSRPDELLLRECHSFLRVLSAGDVEQNQLPQPSANPMQRVELILFPTPRDPMKELPQRQFSETAQVSPPPTPQYNRAMNMHKASPLQLSLEEGLDVDAEPSLFHGQQRQPLPASPVDPSRSKGKGGGPPGAFASTPSKGAGKNLLTMLKSNAPAQVPGSKYREPQPLSVDEFQLWQMAAREDAELGADVHNAETFGEDAPAAGSGWSFEENLEANERLGFGGWDGKPATPQTAREQAPAAPPAYPSWLQTPRSSSAASQAAARTQPQPRATEAGSRRPRPEMLGASWGVFGEAGDARGSELSGSPALHPASPLYASPLGGRAGFRPALGQEEASSQTIPPRESAVLRNRAWPLQQPPGSFEVPGSAHQHQVVLGSDPPQMPGRPVQGAGERAAPPPPLPPHLFRPSPTAVPFTRGPCPPHHMPASLSTPPPVTSIGPLHGGSASSSVRPEPSGMPISPPFAAAAGRPSQTCLGGFEAAPARPPWTGLVHPSVHRPLPQEHRVNGSAPSPDKHRSSLEPDLGGQDDVSMIKVSPKVAAPAELMVTDQEAAQYGNHQVRQTQPSDEATGERSDPATQVSEHLPLSDGMGWSL